MSRNISPSIVGLAQDTTNAEIDSLEVHGENHNVSESDEGQRTQCEFCSTSPLSLDTGYNSEREASPLDHYQLLHEECSTCTSSDDSEKQLCDFCRHLRLRHILGCESKLHVELWKKYALFYLIVDFGGLEAIRSRQNCGLCRLVANTVLIHGQEAPAGNLFSNSNFAKLRIFKLGGYRPELSIYSNLLKSIVDIEFEGKLHRTQTFGRSSWTDKIWPAPSGEEISWDRIRKSLPNITPSPIGRLPSDFRLIDVGTRHCVTVGPTFDGTFAALSYVWGSSMGVGQAGPAADLHNPPHTVEDALHACKELRQNYLWIDQICINQDDPADKANQIGSMAAIYSSASLVIVAARGESVHSGLSGMHLARRNLRARESFLDLEFASVPDFDGDISGSIWSTRGWTLQEVALAKIKVYFSSTGIWLQYEEHGEDFRYSVEFGRFTSTRDPCRPTPFNTFSRHLWEYTQRKLTYDHDIYNAFSGIMTALFGGPEKNIYGLPEQHFNYALLWAPSKDGPPPSIRVLQNNVGQDPVPNPLLPTWSWASVAGGVEISGAANPDNMIPLVKWARIAPSSQPSTPTLIDEGFQREGFKWAYKIIGWIELRFCLAILWSHSGFDSPSPFAPINPEGNAETIEERFSQRWPFPRDFWYEVSSGGSRSPTYPGLDIPGLTGQDDFKLAQLKPGVLLTRAQSSHVWVDPDGYFRDGDQGALIGRLYGEDRGLILQGDVPKDGIFKCVAISLAKEEYQVGYLIEKKFQESGETGEHILSDEESLELRSSFYPGGSFRVSPVIIVMLIGREGQFSYRLGVGWIFLRRWIDLERVFETILLK